MNEIIVQRIKQAKVKSIDEELALIKEMIQELALLGLWRSKFYERACFYGGTALRILHGLERFSEDLDFSLLAPDPEFDIMKYESALKRELSAFGFEVSIEKKIKSTDSKIDSAFIKANTLNHLLKVHSDYKTHRDAVFKIKLEIDLDPPGAFNTEVKSLFWPIPFFVRAYTLHDLFAGKMHACLCRTERQNIKGRDWYDFLWYIGKRIPLNLEHLKMRMLQSGHLSKGEELSREALEDRFRKKVDSIDFTKAKNDVVPFIRNRGDLDAWSVNLFKDAFKIIQISEKTSSTAGSFSNS